MPSAHPNSLLFSVFSRMHTSQSINLYEMKIKLTQVILCSVFTHSRVYVGWLDKKMHRRQVHHFLSARNASSAPKENSIGGCHLFCNILRKIRKTDSTVSTLIWWSHKQCNEVITSHRLTGWATFIWKWMNFVVALQMNKSFSLLAKRAN